MAAGLPIEKVMTVEAAALAQQSLIGTDEATVDDKGRILIAKKKRDRMGEPFVMAMGDTGCLNAYPMSTWQGIIAEISKSPSINQGRQQYTRLTLGLAEDDLRFDKQGRVVVPQKLREAAGLKDRVVIVGALDRLEIWAKEDWDEYEKDPDSFGTARREAVGKAYRQMVGEG